jgi:hypothetical protein
MYSFAAGQARNAAVQSTPSGIQLTCEVQTPRTCCRVPYAAPVHVLERSAEHSKGWSRLALASQYFHSFGSCKAMRRDTGTQRTARLPAWPPSDIVLTCDELGYEQGAHQHNVWLHPRNRRPGILKRHQVPAAAAPHQRCSTNYCTLRTLIQDTGIGE